jgi:hypothetical protein
MGGSRVFFASTSKVVVVVAIMACCSFCDVKRTGTVDASTATESAFRRSNLVLTTTDMPTFTTTFTSPIVTRNDKGAQQQHLSINSIDSFLSSSPDKAAFSDPASSIFVGSNYGNDEDASEAMARYFFFNSNVGSYNTSVSFTIPLFSFSMPDFSGSLLNDLGVSTIFSLATVGILFFGGLALLPFILAYYGAGTLLPFFGGRSLKSEAFYGNFSFYTVHTNKKKKRIKGGTLNIQGCESTTVF